MTVAVGYLAGKGGRSPLYLAVEAAKDAEDVADRRHGRAEAVDDAVTGTDRRRICHSGQTNWRRDSAKEAQECLDKIAEGLDVSYHKFAHAGRPAGLLDAAERTQRRGAGSGLVRPTARSARWCSAPLPTGCCTPRRYRGDQLRADIAEPKAGRLTADHMPPIPGTPESLHVVERVAALAEQLGVPMRVVTFAVSGRTMYPARGRAAAPRTPSSSSWRRTHERRWRS